MFFNDSALGLDRTDSSVVVPPGSLLQANGLEMPLNDDTNEDRDGDPSTTHFMTFTYHAGSNFAIDGQPVTLLTLSFTANISGSATINAILSDNSDPSFEQQGATFTTDIVAGLRPVVTMPSSPPTYTENGPSVEIDTAIGVADMDSTMLMGGTVVITEGTFVSGEEILAFTNTGNVMGDYNADTRTLTLMGEDTLVNYQTFLRTVKFETTSENPDEAERTVTISVTDDDGNTSTPATGTINITAVNDLPTITGGGTAAFTVDENQTEVTDVDAMDPEVPPQTLHFFISDTGEGADDEAFAINEANGVLTFLDPPDFENPTDVGMNRTYDVVVAVSDDDTLDAMDPRQAITVTVRDVNDAPVIDGADPLLVNVDENQIVVTTVTANDQDGDGLRYSISVGADGSEFEFVNPLIGDLTFKVAPDRENATDADMNNMYEVQVAVTDDGTGELMDTLDITVTIDNVDEPPVISFPTTNPAEVQRAEGQTTVLTMIATDPEQATVNYSIPTNTGIAGNADGDKFNVDGASGVVTFRDPPDFNNPTDVGMDRTYEVVVEATDGMTPVQQLIRVEVVQFGYTGDGMLSQNENESPDHTISFQLGTATSPMVGLTGADAALFNIALNPEETAAVITFKTAPDFENRQDDGSNNVYDVNATLSATAPGGGTINADPLPVQIEVLNVDEAPVFMISNPADTSLEDPMTALVTVPGFATGIDTIEPGQTRMFNLMRTDTDMPESPVFTQEPSIDGTTGDLTYEVATDSNGSATFDVTLVDNGSNVSPNSNTSSTVSITINVTAVNDAPTFMLAGNQTADEDPDPATVTVPNFLTMESVGPANESGQSIVNRTVNIVSGSELFADPPPAIDAAGTLTYTPALNANGVASLDVTISDDGGVENDGVDTSAPPAPFTITINAVNDAPVVSTNQGLTIREGDTTVISMSQLETTDVDADATQLTYTIADTDDGPSAGTLLFNDAPAVFSPSFTFTQQDINDEKLSYRHDTTSVTTDAFTFTVDDGGNTGSGGPLTTASETFDIRVLTILAPIANQTFGSGLGPVVIPVAAAVIDGDVPALTSPGRPSFVGFTDNGDGTGFFTFDPQVADEGNSPYTITLNAVTMNSGTDTVTFDAIVVEGPMATSDATVAFVNVGGAGIASQLISSDTGSGASSVRNTGNVFSTTAAIDVSDSAIPDGTPASIFQTQRWDGAGGPEMQFSFPVEPGEYQVNLYFAELYGPAFRTGARVFDVAAEGVVRIDDLDVFAEAGGGNTGLFRTFPVTTADSTLDLAFLHQVENPIVNAIQIINLNQVPSQSAPSLSAIGNQTASEGQTLTIDFRAPDAQGDAVVLTTSPLPSGRFQFTDNGNRTGRLTINAIEGDAGEYPITITATQQNGVALTDAESFVVSVLGTNDPPQIATNVPLGLMEGATAIIGSDRLNANDPDNSAAELTYTLTAGPQRGTVQRDGVNLTSMRFTQAEVNANRIQYVHDGGESTADSFSFTLSDGAGGAVSGSFNINITSVNDAPTIDRSNDLTVRAGGKRPITVAQLSGSDPDDVPANLIYTATTPGEGQILVAGNPSATFTQQNVLDGMVEYENTNDQATSDSFTVTLADDDGAMSATATINVTISNVTILAQIPAQTIAAETGPVDIPVAAASVDGVTPALTATIPAGAQSFVSFTDNGDGTGLFTFDPESGDVGSPSIDLTATAGDVVETVSFTLNVVTVPPVQSNATVHFVNVGGPAIPAAMISGDSASLRNTGSAFSTSAAINLGDASIPDGTPGSLFQTLRYDGAGGAEMKYSFPVDPGDYQVRLYFAETYGPAFRTGARVFDVAVEGVVAIDNLDVFSRVGGNAGLVERIPMVTTADSMLDITFLHQVENPIVSAIEIINLNQVPGQTAPVLDPIGNVTVNEGQTTTLRVSASDAQGDAINAAVSGVPSFVNVSDPDDAGIVTVTITPGEGDAGQYPINATVTQVNDDELTDSESLILTVVGVNEPPELTVNNPLTVDEGANGSIDSSLLNSADPDDASSQLSFSFTVTGGPVHGGLFRGGVPLTSGGLFTQADINDDLIEYRHSGSEQATDSFNFMLADGRENGTPAVPGTFRINIAPINDAPTLDVNTGITLREGTTRVITATALSGSDVDNSNSDLIYTITSPAPAAGTLRVDGAVAPSFTQQQVNDGEVTYTQDGTVTASDSFGFTFSDGTAPAISDTFNISITADPPFELDVNAGGPAVDGFEPAGSTQNGAGTSFGTGAAIDVSDSDVAGIPAAVFQTVLYDPAGGADLSFDVAVEAGLTVEVTLYFSEIYGPAFRTGARVFDVSIEDEVRLPGFDVFSAAGAGNTAIARSFQVTSDGNIDIDLGRVTENPAIAGFRIREIDDLFSNPQNVPEM